MRLSLSVPATNDRGPLYMDEALAVIHQANPHRLPVTFQIGRDKDALSLALNLPPELKPVIESQLFAQYPECRIQPVADETVTAGHQVWTSQLKLRPDLFPIRRFGQFEDALNRLTADPLTALLSAIPVNRSGSLRGRIEIAVRPCTTKRRRRAVKTLRTLSRPFLRSHDRIAHLYLTLALSQWWLVRMIAWTVASVIPKSEASQHPTPLTTSASHTHEREDDLQAASDKLGKHLFEATIRLIVTAPAASGSSARAKLQEMAGSFGLFSVPRLGVFHASRPRVSPTTARRRNHPFLLSTEELATLWHPSTLTVRAPTLAQVESREFEPPVTLSRLKDHPDLAVLGVTAFRDHKERFGILRDDRLRHVSIQGKTGMGKSTLLYNLLISDIAAGRGVCLIDPHGDLAEALLPAIPKARTNDVVLFDAGDREHPLAFNPLFCPDPGRRPLVASGVLSAFKKLFADSWGPRLEHILRNSLLALLEIPGSTLVSVLRLLSDARFRQSVTGRLSDPIVRAFWETEFAAMHPKLQTEAIAPIQNKIGAFVSSPLLRNILGQPEGRLDLRAVMDSGKVLIVNLSKGRIGDDASMLLGSLLVTSLQLAAMSRSDVPESLRREFFVYVDEFQNFATESFATILSEARKYRLGLTLANQYLAQMDDQTASAVFGNVGTLLVFQVGANDAEMLSQQLGGGVTPEDLMTLPRYQAYARLLIDGQPSRPFSMRTLSPERTKLDPKREAIIRRYSRQRYGRAVASIERGIRASIAH
jgi:hypothetical protein